MDDENEEKQMNKNGVVIYELPSEYEDEVLSYFPKETILIKFHTDLGQYIYFKNAGRALYFAKLRKIKVMEQIFKVYLLTTSLTLCGIAPYTSDIRNLMQSKGFKEIIDVYRVQENIENNEKYRSFAISNDYRVNLNVPEIFANYELRPIRLPERPSHAFEVAYFCRFCRQNGHKAFECQESFHTMPFLYNDLLNKKFFGNTSHYPVSEASCSSTVHPQTLSKNTADTHLRMNTSASKFSNPQPQSECTNLKPKRERNYSLSVAIEEAILITHRKMKKDNTPVVLSPNVLRNFLNQVRGRKKKKFTEITFTFTRNIPELITQLDSIKSNYYINVEIRGQNEDRDIRFLENLGKRLRELLDLPMQSQKSIPEKKPLSFSDDLTDTDADTDTDTD